MAEYLIINSYGDLVNVLDSYSEASEYVSNIDPFDLMGYSIEIVDDTEVGRDEYLAEVEADRISEES